MSFNPEEAKSNFEQMGVDQISFAALMRSVIKFGFANNTMLLTLEKP